MDQARRDSLQSLIRRLGLEDLDSPSLLLEVERAMTHTSSGRTDHNERLEFLGDAVLRLAATLYLDRHHSGLTVGDSSSLRAQLVSDRWLAELGSSIGIDALLKLGAKASGDTAARATLRAEHCEALIGAIYRITGKVAPVQTWLAPYWRETSHEVLADPYRGNSKSALQEWTQGQGLGLPSYVCTEISQRHGDPRRFHCQVFIQDQNKPTAEAWGGSRRQAEQQAAKAALHQPETEADGSTAPH